MTPTNRRRNIEAEWERVRSSLRSARILRDAGEYNDAVSRAYYAVFHAAVALLLSVDVEPRSHRAMVQQIHLHFVRSGRLDPTLGRLCARMQKFREEADYNRFFVFDEAATSEELGSAERFVEAAAALLRHDGWMPADPGPPTGSP